MGPMSQSIGGIYLPYIALSYAPLGYTIKERQ